jgi:membrane protein DedA with SNARE-associated domain
MSFVTTFIELLQHMVDAWYGTLGYGGILIAMAIESCLIPLPSEIIMPLAGIYVAQGHFNLWVAATVGALGCVLGSAAAYGLGYWGGRPVVEKFIDRYGKYVLISRRDYELADRWFVKYGSAVTFSSRLMPIVRTFISLPAGISRMNFTKFLFYTFVGSFPWCLMLAWLGTFLDLEKIKGYLHGLDALVVVILVTLIGLYIWRHIKHSGTTHTSSTSSKPNQNLQPTQKMRRMPR